MIKSLNNTKSRFNNLDEKITSNKSIKEKFLKENSIEEDFSQENQSKKNQLRIEQQLKINQSKEQQLKENQLREQQSNELLSVSNISISFLQYTRGLRQNELKVISDLTLSVSPGEIVAILGSSGSGKSLLAHGILGILPNNANLTGEMKFDGKILDQKLKEELRGKEIALIPQSVNYLDPLMKVADQVIGEVADENEKKKKRQQVREVFQRYGLSHDIEDLYPFQLSGGMARRVLISTALLENPKLVIADEPTPGLDDVAIQETLNNIKQMADDGKGVLLITHDINAALKVANKVAIFYSGYVIEIANTEDFSGTGENLKHPYTRALYKALPQNGFHLFKGHQPLHGEHREGCIYYDRCENPTDSCMKINPDLHEIEGKKVRCHKGHRKYSR